MKWLAAGALALMPCISYAGDCDGKPLAEVFGSRGIEYAMEHPAGQCDETAQQDYLDKGFKSLMQSEFGIDLSSLSVDVRLNEGSYDFITAYAPRTRKLIVYYPLLFREWRRDVAFAEEGMEPSLEDTLKKCVMHEYGHYHSQQLAEALGAGDIFGSAMGDENDMKYLSCLAGKCTGDELGEFVKSHSEGVADFLARSAALEAIAQYYEGQREFIGGNIQGLMSIRTSGDYADYAYRIGGHYLVPVLEKYGERGVEYLIMNMPGPSDALNLQGVQERAFQALQQGWEPHSTQIPESGRD